MSDGDKIRHIASTSVSDPSESEPRVRCGGRLVGQEGRRLIIGSSSSTAVTHSDAAQSDILSLSNAATAPAATSATTSGADMHQTSVLDQNVAGAPFSSEQQLQYQPTTTQQFQPAATQQSMPASMQSWLQPGNHDPVISGQQLLNPTTLQPSAPSMADGTNLDRNFQGSEFIDMNQLMTLFGNNGEVSVFASEPQFSLSDTNIQGRTTSTLEKETFYVNLAPQMPLQQQQQQQQQGYMTSTQQVWSQQSMMQSSTMQQQPSVQQPSTMQQQQQPSVPQPSMLQQQSIVAQQPSVAGNGDWVSSQVTGQTSGTFSASEAQIASFNDSSRDADYKSTRSSTSHRTTPSPRLTLTIPPNQNYAGMTQTIDACMI